jgi:hypothetical protein
MEKQSARFNKLIIVIPVIILALLVIGLYLAGLFSLPGSIEAAYQGQDCPKVRNLYGLASRFYSGILQTQPEFSDYSTECNIYLNARSLERRKKWEDAYNSYHDYEQSYASGIMAGDVHEHQAAVLLSWSEEQVRQKQYQEAVGHARMVLDGYSDTASAANAEKLFTETYVVWANSKKTEGDFASAESLLNEFKTWAKNNSKDEYVQIADQELAQTLLEWGTDLVDKQEFTPAEVYLQRSIETAPDNDTGKEIATQATAALVKLHTEWGTFLLAEKKFEASAEQFKKIVETAPAADQPAAQDLLVNVYIKWAAALSDENDFELALEKNKLAQANAATDAGKQAAETALQETYTAFGNSSKSQAQDAMKAAAEQICAGNKPELPIFGTDQMAHAYLYPPQTTPLPDEILATTPASMNYVACILDAKKIYVAQTDWRGHNGEIHEILIQYKIAWEIGLIRVDDGETISQRVFAGDAPHLVYLQDFERFHDGYNEVPGPLPSMDEIIVWIEYTVWQDR